MRRGGFGGPGGGGNDAFDLGDLLAQMFGGAAGPGGPAAGASRAGGGVRYRVYNTPGGGGGFRDSFFGEGVGAESPFDFREAEAHRRRARGQQKAERRVRASDDHW